MRAATAAGLGAGTPAGGGMEARGSAHQLTESRGDRGGARRVNVGGGDDGDAALDRPVVNLASHGRADADLDHPARLDQPLFDGVIEHRAVTIALAESVGPGIDMGIEVD